MSEQFIDSVKKWRLDGQTVLASDYAALRAENARLTAEMEALMQPVALTQDTIREVFLRNGFTIKEGHDDLKPYVYAAANELLQLQAAALKQQSVNPSLNDVLAAALPNSHPMKYADCATCSGTGIVGHSVLCPECDGGDSVLSRVISSISGFMATIRALQKAPDVSCLQENLNAWKVLLTEFQTRRKFLSDLLAGTDPVAVSPSVSGLVEALEFYANGDHLLLAEPDDWDTCSGEPSNFLHDDAGTASVEDGSIAKAALAAHRANGGE
jgi:hypothetical protein